MGEAQAHLEWMRVMADEARTQLRLMVEFTPMTPAGHRYRYEEIRLRKAVLAVWNEAILDLEDRLTAPGMRGTVDP
jgi:hypothetical protein